MVARAFLSFLPLVAGLSMVGCAETPRATQGTTGVELPPVTLDWVGFYAGLASGTENGVDFANRPVDMLIVFDHVPAQGCPACITVRLMTYFDKANLFPQTAIAATWSYELEGSRRTLTLQKFSGGSGPGAVLQGEVTVESANPDGTYTVELAANLVMERVT